jgi:NAD(P)-dependent dehydrogenase (short-subunit alcohol dehydrogenase family)
VTIASMAGLYGFAYAAPYIAAKHGAVGLTRTAASEVAQKGVRVNCVMPGVIETPLLVGMLEQMFDDVQTGMDKLGQVATLNRVGQPREVGDVVSFLLSDEASYVNGAKWEIDGGALATIRNDI